MKRITLIAMAFLIVAPFLACNRGGMMSGSMNNTDVMNMREALVGEERRLIGFDAIWQADHAPLGQIFQWSPSECARLAQNWIGSRTTWDCSPPPTTTENLRSLNHEVIACGPGKPHYSAEQSR